MSKKMMFVGFAVVLSAVTALNVKVALDANRSYDLTMASIAAISQEGGGKENDGKENDGKENGKDDQESNNSGSGIFFYEHLEGRPKECPLYRNVHVDGAVTITEGTMSGAIGWSSTSIKGTKETCPKKGKGCTLFTCRSTN